MNIGLGIHLSFVVAILHGLSQTKPVDDIGEGEERDGAGRWGCGCLPGRTSYSLIWSLFEHLQWGGGPFENVFFRCCPIRFEHVKKFEYCKCECYIQDTTNPTLDHFQPFDLDAW